MARCVIQDGDTVHKAGGPRVAPRYVGQGIWVAAKRNALTFPDRGWALTYIAETKRQYPRFFAEVEPVIVEHTPEDEIAELELRPTRQVRSEFDPYSGEI